MEGQAGHRLFTQGHLVGSRPCLKPVMPLGPSLGAAENTQQRLTVTQVGEGVHALPHTPARLF